MLSLAVVAVDVGAGPLSLADDAVAGVVEVARAGVLALFAEEDVGVAEAGVLLFTVVVLLGVATADPAGLAVDEDEVAGRELPEDTDVLVLLAALLFTVELLAGLVVVADVAGFVEVAGLVTDVVAGRAVELDD